MAVSQVVTMKLDFLKDSHEYRINGQSVPSVTGVLEMITDFSMVPQATLEAARVFGSHVHDACHLMVKGELDWDALDPLLRPYIEAAKRFIEESGCVVLASELAMGSKKMRVAGTLDLFVHWNNSECIIDWKTAAATPPTVGPQTAAYEALYRENFGGRNRKRYCVSLNAGDYKVRPLTSKGDFNEFYVCLQAHHLKGKYHVAA